MPYDERAHIFEAFYTGKAARNTSVKGTGIGLSVVLEFIAAHGGTVQIMDGQFPGAHFRITMPLNTERAHSASGGPNVRLRPIPARRPVPRNGPMLPSLRCRSRLVTVLVSCVVVGGCADLTPNRDGPAADQPPTIDRAVTEATLLAGYLEMLQRLVQGAPAEQAEILSGARHDFETAPTPSHELRYAMVLATPDHPGTDCAKAQKLLRELIATQETLLPAERAMAFLTLKNVDQTLSERRKSSICKPRRIGARIATARQR